MAEDTKISWAHHTFNPWVGCQKVSPGCDNCYAEAWANRFGRVQWGPGAERRLTSDANWRKPLVWDRKAAEAGERRRVFCASLADVFDNAVNPAWRRQLWWLIEETPNLNWLLLTKRPENIAKMMPWNWIDPQGKSDVVGDWGLGHSGVRPNVWLGTTAEDQERYDHRWPILAEIPAVVRFISAEPLLGEVNLGLHPSVPDWIICGGESGPNRRPMSLAWPRILRTACQYWGISFWYKQGNALHLGQDTLLDGVEYHQLPEVA